MNGHWRDRAPNPLLSDLDMDGEPHNTGLDRRWLWRLEIALAINAPMGGTLDQLRQDLRQYLNETCQHHYKAYMGCEYIQAHSQCLWCNDVVWAIDGDPS